MAPSGTVTFLFTDIEGSTRLWEAQPDAMRVCLAGHDEIVKAAIATAGGHIFATGGDGFCAAFARARDAVSAAVEMQREIAARRWPDSVELRVRVGLHTGEAQERDGDYFGPPVNRAARVMAAANGGQILVSDTTAGLLGDAAGLELVDAGEHRLRDVATPLRVLLVRAEGVPVDERPLRTVVDVVGNLPRRLSTLIGREADLAAVAAAVTAHPLLTLTGVGGVGKTQLSLHAATALQEAFPDGAWLVELAPLSDPSAVGHAIAAALGIAQQPGRTAEESVVATVAGRRMLLVLDNCEHLLEAVAGVVEGVLAAAPSVSVLTTSREALGVPGEQVWPVAPLDRERPDSPAAELFTARARAAVPSFEPAPHAEVIRDICRRLDGIPLAIELAAARVRSLSPVQIRDRLEDRFRLLTAGGRVSDGRHQTLHRAVQWSFDLLSDDEREVLCRLAVFAGGFDLVAAEALCAATGVAEEIVVDVVDALVRRSMLVVDRSRAEVRFGLLETIREFAIGWLEDKGLDDTVRDAHATCVAEAADAALDRFASPAQSQVYDWLDLEFANLRAAYRWSATRDLEVAARIVVAAGFMGYWRQHYEPVGWAEQIAASARSARLRSLPSVLACAATCCWLGRVEDAQSYGGEAIALLDDVDFDADRYGWEHIANSLAGYTAGRIDLFVAALAEGASRPQDGRLLANACWEAWGRGAAGDFERARALAAELVPRAEATGIPWTVIAGLHAYGRAFAPVEPAAALEAYRRGLELARSSGNRWWFTVTGSEAGPLEMEAGEPSSAMTVFGEVLEAVWEAGDMFGLTRVLGWLAVSFERLGRAALAARLYGAIEGLLGVFAHDLDMAATVGRLRATLGDGEFDSQRRAGAGLATSEVVRVVRSEIAGVLEAQTTPGARATSAS